YSKAMSKYKINKTIEQISLIAANVQAFYGTQKDFTGLGLCNTLTNSSKANCQLIKKAKLVPEEMLEYNTNGTIEQINNEFGGTVNLGTLNNGKEFYIEYRFVSQEACIELATQDWSSITGSGLRYVAVATDEDCVTGLYGGPTTGVGATDNSTYIVAGPNSAITEISIDQAANICASGNYFFAIGFKK
ncbi:MAG: hypothetical protein IKO06_01000, partial [Alphaproteobacteria bacterium]|nr:hypothetical protein [Alphaproteobacteria bacterium]